MTPEERAALEAFVKWTQKQPPSSLLAEHRSFFRCESHDAKVLEAASAVIERLLTGTTSQSCSPEP